MTAITWDHDRRLDLRGLACPLTVLKSRKALLGMAKGQRLLFEADDPVAAIDIPHFCNEAGHTLIAAEKQGDAWLFNHRHIALDWRSPDSLFPPLS